MLPKLLELVTENGVYRPEELARRLNVTPELVEQGLELLVKRGYLQLIEGCTDGACTACGSSESCRVVRSRMWVRRER